MQQLELVAMNPPSLPPPPAPPSPPPLIPPPSIPPGYACAFSYHASSVTFYAAESACVALGGHLASLHSIGEVDEVKQAVRDSNDGRLTDSWIGLSRTSSTVSSC